jgi:hypothetical protein
MANYAETIAYWYLRLNGYLLLNRFCSVEDLCIDPSRLTPQCVGQHTESSFCEQCVF